MSDASEPRGSAERCVSLPVTGAPVELGACRCRAQASVGPISDAAEPRAGFLFAGGAVLSGLFSSACCWIPLALVAFGASAAGVAGFVERFRPVLLVTATVLLSLSFYTAYFRQSACCAGRPWSRRVRRVTPWIAAALVGGFVFFPERVAGFVSAITGTGSAERSGVAASTDNADGTRTITLIVEGMSCERCAERLRAELERVEGVRSASVSHEAKSAVVIVQRAVQSAALVNATDAMGFRVIGSDAP